MKFLPRNRKLLLQKVGTEQTEKEKKDVLSGFVLPDDVEPLKRGSEIYKVLDKAPDVTLEVEVGDFVSVEDNMVSKKVYGKTTFLYITENYVEGILDLEEM